MGAAAPLPLKGRKGGSSKPKAPKEAQDSLQSVATAKILIAVGEGEFDEAPTAQNIYLDNTPLGNADGSLNFEGVVWDWRPGSIDQTYIPGIPSIENETTINVELSSSTAWVRSISNAQLSAVRIRFAWPALQQQKDNGDVVGYRIEYAVDVAADGGAYVEVLNEAVDGKTTSRYERSRRIDLPEAESGWQIRVRRITANANSNRIADTMLIAGFTEVVDAKLSYPNSALLYVEFSAEQFQNIPAVTVECRARRVQVPSNYDPLARTYTGIWDGTMKSAWTDNPVWHTYDLVTNDRFGLGKRIKAWMVDRWEMYRIAQYCDQLVPDGKGGQEPRHTCNLNLQSRARAWDLLRDMTAIYRGMTYWAKGQLNVQADIPRATDFDFAFARANVIDGKFGYASASERTRYSRALVSYDNPANNYDTDVAVATDKRLQLRYGDNPAEISAIGCTRESEAQRRGKWTILTNSQDRTVTFRVGLDGRIPLPGYVIPVADSLLAGRDIGGRISAVSGNTITLDRDTQAKPGDRLIVNLPSGKCEGRTVQSVTGRAVTVTTAFSEAPRQQLVWALDADDLAVPLYRVMKMSRPEKGVFEITALQYEPSKFAAIDTGAKLETRPISVLPTGVIDPPASVSLSTYTSIDQGIAVTSMTIAWPAVSGAVAYDVEWRRDDGNWIRLPRVGTLSVDVSGIYAGTYVARVRAVNAFELSSTWRTSDPAMLEGKTTPPPAVSYLTATPLVFGIRLDWGFPTEGAADTQRTEIQYNTSAVEAGALHLGDYAYPTDSHTLTGLAAGVTRYFRARLIDRSENIGPWSSWVMGQSSTDATEILGYIAGKIGETQLAAELMAVIDLITAPASTAGSVDARISSARGALEAQINTINAQLADIVGAEAYDNATPYVLGDLVTYEGGLYRALQSTTGNLPTNATYWEKIGDYASLGEAVSALAVELDELTTRVQAGEDALTAEVERIDGIFAQVNPPMAGDTGWYAGSETVLAGVWSEQYARASEDGALGRRLDAVVAQAQGNAAAITAEATARADAVEALAEQIDTLTATVEEDITAAIQSEATARANADGALSSRIDTVEVTAGDNSAAIQQTSEALAGLDGELSAMWSVKLAVTQDGTYYGAGMGIGIENTPEGMQTQILFQADRFAVINVANGQIATPFVIQGGQVFINSAVIGDGTIDMAKIATALQSTNYAQGQSGWRLSKDGNFEINASVADDGRMLINNNGVYIYDDNNVLRVELGKLN